MSRDADSGIQLYLELFDKGINLVFIKEHFIDTDTYRKAITESIDTTGNEIADIYIEATNKVIKLLATKQIRQAFEQAEKEVEERYKINHTKIYCDKRKDSDILKRFSWNIK